jgi:hypothetical protein
MTTAGMNRIIYGPKNVGTYIVEFIRDADQLAHSDVPQSRGLYACRPTTGGT